jgi:hypothetical protein
MEYTLEDYPLIDLLQEIATRYKRQAQGLCDYCGREPITPPCQFLSRHFAAMHTHDDEHELIDA